jgi:RNA polymerase sigma-70 factor (ECF subfamily)
VAGPEVRVTRKVGTPMVRADDPSDTPVSAAWRAHRSYLVNLAFSMLRDIGAAEDAVQEAFGRLTGADVERIEDLRGWLIVVTSRICFDQIGSARARHEATAEPAAIDLLPSTSPSSSADPADRITLDDDVRRALLVVLERLSPAERVAFVLHDVFGLPFETIAETVGRSAPTCRQLARRARLAVRTDKPRDRPVDPLKHREVVERFIQACANGDLDGLLPLLDANVSGEVDLGARDIRTGVVVHGPRRVGRNLLHYFGEWTTLVSDLDTGQPAVLAFLARRPYALIALTIEDRLITKIHVTANPAKAGILATGHG